MTAWHVVTWSSKSLRVLQRPSIVQRSPSCSAMWIHVKLCNQMPRYWMWQKIWWDFIKCRQFGPLDTAMSLRTDHLWAATGKTFDIFDPPSCANQNRTPSLVAPSDNDTIRASRPAMVTKTTSSHQALKHWSITYPNKKQDCTAVYGDKVFNSHVNFGSDVGVTHCRSFFIWPDLPNVCRFFKQTRGSVWAVLFLLSSFNSARPTL